MLLRPVMPYKTSPSAMMIYIRTIDPFCQKTSFVFWLLDYSRRGGCLSWNHQSRSFQDLQSPATVVP
ncbi:hypothetical protein P8452_71987 [Trifolium repens]|nr:hypothetical protein P8452_71987 [Trifolium repens]